MQIFKDAIEAIEDLLKSSTHLHKCKANYGTIAGLGFERRHWKEEYCNCHMAKGRAVLEMLKKEINKPELKSMTVHEWAFGKKDVRLCARCGVNSEFRCADHEFCANCTDAIEVQTSQHSYDPGKIT
jgi:hypothetical protein